MRKKNYEEVFLDIMAESVSEINENTNKNFEDFEAELEEIFNGLTDHADEHRLVVAEEQTKVINEEMKKTAVDLKKFVRSECDALHEQIEEKNNDEIFDWKENVLVILAAIIIGCIAFLFMKNAMINGSSFFNHEVKNIVCAAIVGLLVVVVYYFIRCIGDATKKGGDDNEEE